MWEGEKTNLGNLKEIIRTERDKKRKHSYILIRKVEKVKMKMCCLESSNITGLVYLQQSKSQLCRRQRKGEEQKRDFREQNSGSTPKRRRQERYRLVEKLFSVKCLRWLRIIVY